MTTWLHVFKATKLLKMISCPDCHSTKIKKNGLTHYGKQNHKCKNCGRQFVLNNTHTISSYTKGLIRNFLKERISLQAICRCFSVSMTWLMDFAVKEWLSTPDNLGLSDHSSYIDASNCLQILDFQADEMWSFVGCKANKAWIWVVYDPHRGKVISYHIGSRGKESAQALWTKLPSAYKDHCSFSTDDWEAYQSVIPKTQHLIGKAHTHNIEGIFATFRARISRLVRKSLSFSKIWKNHVAAIGYFFWQFNIET